MRKADLIAVAFIITCSLVTLLAFFYQAFPLTYDTYHRLNRLAKYYVALHQGQIPPRWIGQVDHGVGSPLFIYLYPFMYLIGAVLHSVYFSLIDSLKIIYVASFIGAGIGMYAVLRKLFPPRAALLGTVFFQWAPYRIVQVYVRGVPEELLGYALAPFIFLAALLIHQHKPYAWLVLGTLSGVLFLTISSVPIMIAPVVVTLLLISAYSQKSIHPLRELSKAGVLAFGISAMIWLPILFERSSIQYENLFGLYKDNFLHLRTLLNDQWNFVPTPQELGKAHIVILMTGLIGILSGKKFSIQTAVCAVFLFWIAAYLGIAIEHPVSRFIWRAVPAMTVIYVPILYLGMIVFLIGYVAAYVWHHVVSWRVLQAVLATFILSFAIMHARPTAFIYEQDANMYSFDASPSFGEFLPKTAGKGNDPFTQAPPLISVSDATAYEVREDKYHRKLFRIRSNVSDRLIVHQLYFPGWSAYLDGVRVPITYTDRGLMLLSIIPGDHDLLLAYEKTIVQRAGELLTFLGIAFAFITGATHLKLIARYGT